MVASGTALSESGINYIERDIYLGQDHYHVMDKCIDPEGNLIWGLEGNEFSGLTEFSEPVTLNNIFVPVEDLAELLVAGL